MKIRSIISDLFHLFIVVNCVSGVNINQIRYEIFAMKKDFNLPTAIIQSISNNWTENRDCFFELDAIENGVRNFDEWAIKSMYVTTIATKF